EMPRITSQLGFTFEYDARRQPASWRPVGADGLRGRAAARGSRPRPVQRTQVLPRIPVTLRAQGIVRRSVREDDPPGTVARLMQCDFLSHRHACAFLRDAGVHELPSEKGIGICADALEADGIYFVIDLGRQEV